MRVRRKSEIAEAVQWDGSEETRDRIRKKNGQYPCAFLNDTNVGWWCVFGKGRASFLSPEDYATDYEPVPEPPARHPQGPDNVILDMLPDPAPSVSEEQPAPNTGQKRIAIQKGESLRGENNAT